MSRNRSDARQRGAGGREHCERVEHTGGAHDLIFGVGVTDSGVGGGDTKLRQAEIELGRGVRTPLVCKKLGVSEQTYYRWRREYGGLRLDQAKRLKELERENTRLKRLVADQALDNAILKEVASGKF